ncbi:hypothetical protein BHE74_00033735 [Ensete ventricosum]|nr:hypothetical protein GW17_00030751 [Ensete ventricosum]RWW59337.1 hypothetical protein BHE74_00033735 [Ensete ventricosum]RZR95607.1 hypothetical protein BHM03_00024481 [Ensete ventricosum]
MYLLLQISARARLPEGDDGGRGDGERFPMFRTGTGRAVSVSESSIRKARSVLGGAGDADTSGSIRHGGQYDGFPLFSTGSGKSVTIKESSLRKAAAVLEGNGIHKDQENARSFTLKNIYSGNKTPVNQKPEKDDLHSAGSAVEIVRRIENGDGTSLGGPLIDISNIAGDYMTMNRLPNEKRRPGKTSYVSPFKRPRSSRSLEDYTDSALKLLMIALHYLHYLDEALIDLILKLCITDSKRLVSVFVPSNLVRSGKPFQSCTVQLQEIRQSHLQKKIEKALKDAGLVSREVTPFMRVRVAGLTSKHSCRKGRFREGLITIWSPTEDQVMTIQKLKERISYILGHHHEILR